MYKRQALIYGIMKLQDKITKDPSLGWRERYGSHGTEEVGDQAAEEAGRSPAAQASPEGEQSTQNARQDAPRR